MAAAARRIVDSSRRRIGTPLPEDPMPPVAVSHDVAGSSGTQEQSLFYIPEEIKVHKRQRLNLRSSWFTRVGDRSGQDAASTNMDVENRFRMNHF